MTRSRVTSAVIALLLVVTFIVAAFALLRPDPLVYEGKTLDEWLKPVQAFSPITVAQTDAERSAATNAATKAILHFGTRAIPYCMERIQAETPWWRALLLKHKFYKTAYLGGWDYPEVMRARAVYCLSVLGERAESVAPELQGMLNNPQLVGAAATALFTISADSAKLPLPYVTNQNPLLRRPVITAMFDAEFHEASKLSSEDSRWIRKVGLTVTLPNGARTY